MNTDKDLKKNESNVSFDCAFIRVSLMYSR